MPQGRLTDWDDDRGFGFITTLDGGSRVFAHISEFPREKRRPEPLDLLTFTLDRDPRGRLRAKEVRFLTPTRSRRSARDEAGHPKFPAVLAVSPAFLLLLLTLTALKRIPPVLAGTYMVLSAGLFVAYGFDKAAAQRGDRRESEASLHLLALLGGWPGALIAQQVFRHKTIKQPFQTVFWVTVFVNCAALVGFLLLAPG